MPSEIETLDYPDVRALSKTLGCNPPSSLAILPRNLESAKQYEDLFLDGEAATVRILWRGVGLEEERLDSPDAPFPQLQEKSFVEWVGPTLFIGFSLWSQNEALVTLALSVISDYVTDFLKGLPGEERAKLDIVIETRDGSNKKVNFRGPVSGLKELPDILRSVAEVGDESERSTPVADHSRDEDN